MIQKFFRGDVVKIKEHKESVILGSYFDEFSSGWENGEKGSRSDKRQFQVMELASLGIWAWCGESEIIRKTGQISERKIHQMMCRLHKANSRAHARYLAKERLKENQDL